MNIIKLGFLGLLSAVALLSARAYMKDSHPEALKLSALPGQSQKPSPRAFVEIPLPDGQRSDGVVIFAPANCPSAAAQRADALARHLDKAGIPYRRSQSAEFGNLKSQEEADRIKAVMGGEIPVVFVRARARANPSGEDVVAEYRAGGMR